MSGDVPFRYRSPDEDSGRWTGFRFRDGDIVISTRSKSGTTWVQMICALLVFQTADLPMPLWQLSPWLDWLVTPSEEVRGQLSAQAHRRFIKTHTPLDGIPLDRRATYIVVGRHPLDMAVSLFHQGENLDRELIARLTGQPQADASPAREPLREWLRSWIDWNGAARERLDSLPGVMWHLGDAWSRRGEPNVVLVHYQDLADDLEGEMRRLATTLGITVPERTWPTLVEAAMFDRMRARADQLVPDPVGVLKDATAFFRGGWSGQHRQLVSRDEVDRYHSRTMAMAPPDLLAWLHRA
ncbi:MAG: putative sulfotransferase [Acidimicrobiales bacterium]|nr:putative sulfotransferase [Acidimicrobiales bacterium]